MPGKLADVLIKFRRDFQAESAVLLKAHTPNALNNLELFCGAIERCKRGPQSFNVLPNSSVIALTSFINEA